MKEQKQFNRTKIVFSANGAEKNTHPQCKKKMYLDTDLAYFIKINSKLIIDLNENIKV